MYFNKLRFLFLVLLGMLSMMGYAQQLVGTVFDAYSGERLPYVNIKLDGGKIVTCDGEGNFSISEKSNAYRFIYVGYKPQTIRPANNSQRLIVKMQPQVGELTETVVTGRKKRYRRKDNPAVALMRKVIARKDSNSLKGLPYYQFDKYSRTQFAFNEVTDKVFQEGHFKRMPFLKDCVEVCDETGKLILTVSDEEIVERETYSRNPEKHDVRQLAKDTRGVSTLLYTGEILTSVLQDCFTDVDIYKDKVRLLQHPFDSPLSSSSGISFYRYFIADTLDVNGIRAIQVDFTPNNAQDFGFSGSLYIAADSSYQVVRVDIGVPPQSSANFVDNMRIIQSFRQLPSGEHVLEETNMVVELSLVDFLQKFMVKRVTRYSDYAFEPEEEKKDFSWNHYRQQPEEGRRVDTFLAGLGKMKLFKPLLWIGKAFVENYLETSSSPNKPSKVDIGPVSSMLSFNNIEGFRMRASAQTTANLNPHLFLRGYVAYGFRDRKVKGMGEITWSFNKKKYLPREFPVHNLTFTYTNDIQAPTDKFLTMDKDNTFTSFKWTKVRHMMYFQRFQLLYDREWENNLRMTLQFRHETDTPTGDLRYEKLNGEVLKKMRTTDFTIGLAYRPGTKWVETKQHRRSLGHDYPVYSISHTTGIKGFLGGQYNYNLTEITLERRFWLQSWGKIDAQVKAGIQWNKVPFPLLITPAANLSYFMSRNTFSLIDNMEFLNDRYASLMLSWDINGKILNRIPLIRRLKWREYIGLNVLYGDLTSKNNPFLQRNAASNRLFVFPAQSHAMTNKPYIEAVIGLHNIFRFFHIEYVRRLTYTEGLPERRKWGIRGKLELAF